MKVTSLSLRFLLALLGTMFFYFCLLHSGFGLYFPLPAFYFHQIVQLIVPTFLFFIAFYPSLKPKLHPIGIIAFSLVVSVFCEFVLVMAFGMVTAY